MATYEQTEPSPGTEVSVRVDKPYVFSVDDEVAVAFTSSDYEVAMDITVVTESPSLFSCPPASIFVTPHAQPTGFEPSPGRIPYEFYLSYYHGRPEAKTSWRDDGSVPLLFVEDLPRDWNRFDGSDTQEMIPPASEVDWDDPKQSQAYADGVAGVDWQLYVTPEYPPPTVGLNGRELDADGSEVVVEFVVPTIRRSLGSCWVPIPPETARYEGAFPQQGIPEGWVDNGRPIDGVGRSIACSDVRGESGLLECEDDGPAWLAISAPNASGMAAFLLIVAGVLIGFATELAWHAFRERPASPDPVPQTRP